MSGKPPVNQSCNETVDAEDATIEEAEVGIRAPVKILQQMSPSAKVAKDARRDA